ncbi:MAG: thiamine-phosphate kinase [Sulfuricurvum sp. GWF2_44_89]|uniref:Thiamine-monophosphate kinase n=1 Tax=Sulfuricurvum kujiense TaxID=148813 RepID=A0A2D3W8S9_9BACT|nr:MULTISPECIES: thiamine-phosphate kinase [Sulfuricurvum]OHD79500.1 MAG: thiamine-phosphate kinase [Sulfuricurvum sp. GWF2_44_89]OHD94390.1 MAG: thiamine-phosphate kinase [Sulfuricurvum sp. RIFOXYD12_FULL_44_77]OHD95109.1 MAG: thiamine-phosphate kinase [Sulfuricurvum sp. RIFOXYD2_FULL_44_160]DAB37742.1 MAG TPA: thiamine-phosphate kinase [Sulfuricurvum kujiense]
MNAENYFISTFCSSSSHIGDDGAILGEWVYSKDLFFENVHFKRTWLSLYQIGYKAMIINISDAIAMNAVPKYALLGVAMPKSMSLSQMDELSRGMQAAAAEYNIEIIGGDTIGNCKLDLSVTIISHATAPLVRRGLKRGDIFAYTGEIGKSAKQLRYLLAGGSVHTQSRFATPKLRQSFVTQSRPYLRCGMDISDGLFSDIEKLCRSNRMGVRFLRKIEKKVGCSGEEYEMLVAFPPHRLNTIRRIAARNRTTITPVARAVRGSYLNRCKRHHF